MFFQILKQHIYKQQRNQTFKILYRDKTNIVAEIKLSVCHLKYKQLHPLLTDNDFHFTLNHKGLTVICIQEVNPIQKYIKM